MKAWVKTCEDFEDGFVKREGLAIARDQRRKGHH